MNQKKEEKIEKKEEPKKVGIIKNEPINDKSKKDEKIFKIMVYY